MASPFHAISCNFVFEEIDQNSAMDNYWLFGYGSLIWKPPPHHIKRVSGYIKGSVRRFWQSSNDHRGTPESPGRVVTLITKDHWRTLNDPHPYGEDDVVWGVAYLIDPVYAKEVKAYMDYREKNGYTEVSMPFYTETSQTPLCMATVYVGTPDNEAFVGPQDPDIIARIIATNHGPSGPNLEYLLELDKAVKTLNPKGDAHLDDLVNRALSYSPENSDRTSDAAI